MRRILALLDMSGGQAAVMPEQCYPECDLLLF